jgi:uncharacterized protein (TIGR03067 family)
MNIQSASALAAFFLLLPCSTTNAQEARQPAEKPQSLQGKWEGAEAGREADGKCVMTINADSIHFQGANQNEWYKATFVLPIGTTPQQLVGKITDCPQPDFVGKSACAIFKIEDGKLTLVGHKPGDPDAPKSFEGDASSRTFIFTKTQPK